MVIERWRWDGDCSHDGGSDGGSDSSCDGGVFC